MVLKKASFEITFKKGMKIVFILTILNTAYKILSIILSHDRQYLSISLIVGVFLNSFLIISIFWVVIFLFYKRFVEGDKDRLLKGTMVVDDTITVEAINEQLDKTKKDGIRIHPNIVITKHLEKKHFLVVGSPQAGKTNLIMNFLSQAHVRGDKAIIYDHTGEYSSVFMRLKNCKILSPFDSRSVSWSISSDISGKLSLFNFANSIIQNLPSEMRISDAARDILIGVLECLKFEGDKKGINWNWLDLHQALSSEKKIREMCALYREGALMALGQETSDYSKQIFSQLRAATIKLEFMKDAWPDLRNGFSITKWVSNQVYKDINLLIVKPSSKFVDMSNFFVSSVFDIYFNELLSHEERNIGINWAFLDNLGELPKINMLIKSLSNGYSSGLRIVAGIKDWEIIPVKYGNDLAAKWIDMFGILLAGKCNSASTATFLSSAFGVQQIRRSVQNIRASNQNIVVEPALFDSEFVNLPVATKNGSFFIKVPSCPVGKLSFPLQEIPSFEERYFEPNWMK